METDASWQPLDPVGRWYGPLKQPIDVKWIAQEIDCHGTPRIVPEKEFPSHRHFRRPDQCIPGSRPFVPLPRGLRLTINGESGATGMSPPGVIGTACECWDPDPANAPRNRSMYSANDGLLPTAMWLLWTDADGHRTDADPLAYGPDDFVLRADALYTATDATRWRVLFAPFGYSGGAPLPADPLHVLAIARRNLPPPTNKSRALAFPTLDWVPCGPDHVWPPVVIPTDQTETGLIQTPQAVGRRSLRWTFRQVLLGSVGLYRFVLRAGALFCSARGEWESDLLHRYRYTLDGAGAFPRVSSRQPASGDRCELRFEYDGRVRYSLLVNGDEILAHDDVNPFGFTRCLHEAEAHLDMAPVWSRSDAQFDFRFLD